MKTFKISKNELNGTCLQGEITCSYKDIVSLFGKPNKSATDGYKVSTIWVLEDEDGNVVDLYDWKQTKSYDSNGYTIREFRSLPQYSWHIGGHKQSDAIRLQEFIQSKLGRTCKTWLL